MSKREIVNGLAIRIVRMRPQPTDQHIPALWAPRNAQPPMIAESLIRYLTGFYPHTTIRVDTDNAKIYTWRGDDDITLVATYTVLPNALDESARFTS